VQHEALTLSYWFDPGSERTVQPVVIRFTGHRLGIGARTSAQDQFVQEERIDSVGSGRVCVTSRVQGINPGEWEVSATVIDASAGPVLPTRHRVTGSTRPVHRAAWSWRSWSLSEAPDGPVHTQLTPFPSIPGIVPGIWPAMLALGVVVALVSFARLYGPLVGSGPAISVVIAALLTGAVGAKAWFVLLHWGRRSEENWFIGWCIQGFVAGVLLAVGVAALLGTIPAGPFLDAAAPGVLLGIAAGRIGCFLAGCCMGRPTQSRWGIWSSDRRVGMRRIPTQLMEAALAAGLGVAALVFVVRIGTAHGGVFAASLAAYTLLRQGILGLRAEPRLSSIGPPLIAAAAVGVIAADILVHAIGVLHLPAGA
jgi:phosphatidylglycerol:prolipoprotein diacylglycerol transferase